MATELWGVTSASSPSSLYRFEGPTRIDEIDGHDQTNISCATDLAESANGNLLAMSCSNELQELSTDSRPLKLLGAHPTLPSESARAMGR